MILPYYANGVTTIEQGTQSVSERFPDFDIEISKVQLIRYKDGSRFACVLTVNQSAADAFHDEWDHWRLEAI